MRYSLKRKKLKYSLKFNTLDFNKIKILKFKKKKWFRLKKSFLRPKIEKKNKIKVFNVKKNSFSNFNVFIKRTFRENSLIIKRIRNIFMDYRRKSLRNFFLKNESLIFISQNKLKYVLKDAFFVESFYSAKQHIKHSRILVNNIKVSNPNYLLKNNDIVTLKNRGSSKIRINYFKKC
jgi:ribosomal protein S4